MTTTQFLHKPLMLKGLAIVLWLVSSALALFALNAVADVAATIYAAFWAGGGVYGDAYYSAVALRQMVILPGSLLLVAVVVGSLEYHLRHVNTPGSWRLFSYVAGVEAGILLLEAML